MKVDFTLINPVNHYRKTLVDNLAILNLRAVSEAAGFSTHVIDFQRKFLEEEKTFSKEIYRWFSDEIKAIDSHVFGVSIMNASYIWGIMIAKIIKRAHPESVIIFGGPQITSLREMVFQDCPEVDFLSIFDGEETLPLLLEYIACGAQGDLPKNSISKTGDSGLCELIEYDINNLPELDYSNSYGMNVVNIEAGRGCPFNCYYCSSRVLLGQKARFLNVDKLLETSQRVYDCMAKTGALSSINYNHDNFLASHKYFFEFAVKNYAMNYDFKYNCEGRIDTITPEIIGLLKATGCISVFVGLETGSQRIQRICRKNLNLKKVIPTVKSIISSGMRFETNFIIGFPEETYSEVLDTLALAQEVASTSFMSNVDFSYMSPEPLTDVAQGVNKEDYIIVKESQYYLDLLAAGIDPNSLSPLHFNHLYTVRNENYDILDVLARADTYFDLINHFKFATYLMIHRDGRSIEDIFEMCRDRDAFAVAESYTATLDQAGVYYAVSCFEIDRLAIVRREERAQDVLFYRYPVQKLYQLFIETMNISGFESVASTPTKIVVRSAK